MMQDLVIHGAYIAFAIGVLMTFGLILTWVERKQAAVMSDRIGANRAYIRIPFTDVKLVWWGLFHGMADGLKMLVKEDWKPRTYDWYAYAVAPWVVFTPVLLVFAVIPFGGTLAPEQTDPESIRYWAIRPEEPTLWALRMLAEMELTLDRAWVWVTASLSVPLMSDTLTMWNPP